MSAVAEKTKTLSDKLFNGTFELRLHLDDHTTQDNTNQIISAVNQLIELHHAAHPRTGPFSPRFAFGGVEGDAVKIELFVMRPGQPNVECGIIPLKWKKVGNDQILTIRKQSRQRHIEHMNAGFNLTDLRMALSIRRVYLHEEKNEALTHHLDFFEAMDKKHPAEFTFDLDFNDEGVTIVAFRNFERHSVFTAFVQS